MRFISKSSMGTVKVWLFPGRFIFFTYAGEVEGRTDEAQALIPDIFS
jgi:hypothetical protein